MNLSLSRDSTEQDFLRDESPPDLYKRIMMFNWKKRWKFCGDELAKLRTTEELNEDSYETNQLSDKSSYRLLKKPIILFDICPVGTTFSLLCNAFPA